MFLLEAEGIKMAKHRNTRNIVYVFSISVFSYNKSNQNFNILLEPSDKEPNVKQPTTLYSRTSTKVRGKCSSRSRTAGGILTLKTSSKQFHLLPPFAVEHFTLEAPEVRGLCAEGETSVGSRVPERGWDPREESRPTKQGG